MRRRVHAAARANTPFSTLRAHSAGEGEGALSHVLSSTCGSERTALCACRHRVGRRPLRRRSAGAYGAPETVEGQRDHLRPRALEEACTSVHIGARSCVVCAGVLRVRTCEFGCVYMSE